MTQKVIWHPNMAPSFLLLYIIANKKILKWTHIDRLLAAFKIFPTETRSNNSGRYTCCYIYLGMDSVKVALGNRGMMVEAASQCTKDRKEWSGWHITEWVSRGHYCLALCSLGPPSHALMVITWRGVGCHYMMQLGKTVKRAYWIPRSRW